MIKVFSYAFNFINRCREQQAEGKKKKKNAGFALSRTNTTICRAIFIRTDTNSAELNEIVNQLVV